MPGTLRRLPGTNKLIRDGSTLARDDNCCCFPQGTPVTCRKYTYSAPAYGCGSGATFLVWDGSSTFSVTAPGTVDATLSSGGGDIQYGDLTCTPPIADKHCCNWLDATVNLPGVGNCIYADSYPFCVCSNVTTSTLNAGMAFFSPNYHWLVGVCLRYVFGATRIDGWAIYKSDLPLPKDVPTSTYWLSAGIWSLSLLTEYYQKSTDFGATYNPPATAPCILGGTATLEVSG